MRARLRSAFRLLAAAVFCTGIFLHGYSIVFGRAAMLAEVFTPVFDLVFAVPMSVCALGYWVFYRDVAFRSKLDRGLYLFCGFYMTMSVPLHVRTVVAWSTDHLAAFPDWYSWVIVPVMAFFAWQALALRFAGESAPSQRGPDAG